MGKPLDHILVVGGGAAGWLTAAYLAARLGGARPGGTAVTLVESSDIPIIGVGEGTFPSIKRILKTLGVTEEAFLRGSSGAFKQAIRFVDWAKAPQGGRHSHYYHPFNLPTANPGELDLTPYWLMGMAGETPLSQATGFQDLACDACLGPKPIDGDPWVGPMNYAYHFDAGRLAEFLAGVGQSLGVKRVIDTVESVALDPETGAIASITTAKAGALTADLFIDCTGFRARLIGEALGADFRGVDEVLLVDRALAVQVPYAAPDHPIASATISTAHEAGWTWDIGLDARRGVGYVYSSHHTGDDRAEEILRAHVGPAMDALTPRQLNFKLGYRDRQWIKNCVAVGLSAGFLEPLESTGLVMISAAAEMIADFLPSGGAVGGFEPAAKAFNAAMVTRYEHAVDFLKLHYCLSARTDHAFWTDNAGRSSWSGRLIDKIDMWRARPPSDYDLSSTHESFGLASWRFVLYGMGFRTDLSGREAHYPHAEAAAQAFKRIEMLNQAIVRQLPTHRALIDEINRTGFRAKAASS